MTMLDATLNATHAPDLRSWVASANAESTDFPIQNLPFGCFTAASAASHDTTGIPRMGIAIGDQMLDLRLMQFALLSNASPAWALTADTAQPDTLRDWLAPLAAGDLNAFMALGPAARLGLRAWLSAALAQGSPLQATLQPCLRAQADCTMQLPCRIGDYTDFYSGIHHATTVGKLFRPDNPLLPNYKWVPIGYHGRASSIGVSGQQFRRPIGQTLPPGADAPSLGPCKRLDLELELGIFIGSGNALGEPVPITRAEDHVFGICLLNDWSARDIQAWEYQPLGPFLSKNFATTVSPWVVTLEALAPYRLAFTRPEGDPQPMAYLDSAANRAEGAFDIQLQVGLQTPKMREAGQPDASICRTTYRHAYWTVAQMLTHHTVNGCNLQPGDLLGSGTLSGPTLDQAGALIELTAGGKNPIVLPNGEQRTWLEDGDSVVLRGWCEREGAARIGFGECVGKVLPARP
jgi:fumarylacetoacetase